MIEHEYNTNLSQPSTSTGTDMSDFSGWKELRDPQGRTYYQNDHTQQTQWERPTAAAAQQPPPLPPQYQPQLQALPPGGYMCVRDTQS